MSRILCVVPTRWPLVGVALLMNQTWLRGCDRRFFGVDAAAQLPPRTPHEVVERTYAHEDVAREGYWLLVKRTMARAAGAPMDGMDWMLLTETDAFVRVAALRHFLRERDPREAHFFGQCDCRRSPGVNVLSRAAARRLRFDGCPSYFGPENVTNRASRTVLRVAQNGGSSDRGIDDCLAREGLACTVPVRGRAHLMSTFGSVDLRALLSDLRRGRSHAAPAHPCYAPYRGATLFSRHAFAMHPIKDARLMGDFARAWS